MTIMGELLFKTSSEPCYSEAQTRGGKNATFYFDISQMEGTSPTLTITPQHKNVVDDSWTDLTAITITTTGPSAASTDNDVREQVRLKFVVGGTNSWFRCFTLPIVWS
jgi:hypothetical protein